MQNDDWKKSEQILKRRIAKTSSLIRRVDLVGALLAVGSAGMLLLLAGIVLDHLFISGLPKNVRLLYATASGAFLFVFTFFRFLPLIRYRVNSLYSAQRLEESAPALKNSLINWLLLKESKDEGSTPLSSDFIRKLSIKTAETIPNGIEDTSVDTRPILRWGIVFILSAVLLAGYAVCSRKSPFVSAARIIIPAAHIEAPQVTEFRKVEPGNCALYSGKKILIKAEIGGAGSEPVFLSYSTPDGRLVNQRIPMESKIPGYYELNFPAEEAGLTEPLDYQIIVGNPEKERGHSQVYRLDVKPAISFLPISIEYHYPEYTGLSPRIQENEGDIEAPEGTTVIVTAESNVPLVRPLAVSDFSTSHADTMEIDAKNPLLAVWKFKLKTKEEGKERESYQLYGSDGEMNFNIDNPGNSENSAPRWQIRSLPDPPPSVSWINLPSEEELTVPLNKKLELEIEAEDAEYGLSSLRVELSLAEKQGEEKTVDREIPSIDLGELLSAPNSNQKVVTKTAIIPYEFNLKEGDIVECRVTAADNRHPNPSQAETDPITFTVTQKTDIGIPQNESDDEKEDPAGENTNQENSNSGKGQSDTGEGKSGESSDSENQSQNGGTQKDESDSGKGGQKGDSESGESEGQEGEGQSEAGQGDSDKTDSNQLNHSGGNEGESGEAESESAENNTPSNGEAGTSESRENKDEGSGTSGQAGSSGQSSQTGEETPNNPSGDTNGEGNGEGEGFPNSEDSGSAPIDPETDPGSAFETILDFTGLDVESAPSTGNPAGFGTGVSLPDGGKKKNSSQVDPSQMKAGDGTASADAERQTETSPAEIPEDALYENGEVDPNTNSYLAASGQSNGSPPPISPDANVNLDPNQTKGESGGSEGEPNKNLNLPPEGESTAAPANGNKSGEKEGNSAEINGNTEFGNPDNNDQQSSAEPPLSLDLPVNETHENSEDSPQPKKEGKAGNHSDAEKLPSGGGPGFSSSEETHSPKAAADRANRAYAEKATALVLTYLDDQIQNGVDPELLNRLGWTETELQEFHQRWKEMQKRAGMGAADSPERRKYEEALQDMGLRPSQKLLHAGPQQGPRSNSGTRSSRRSEPPAAYRERFRMYNEGILKK